MPAVAPAPCAATVPHMRCLFLLGVLTACVPCAETIRIVSSLPRTGSANAQTTTIVHGIALAIEEAGGAVTLGGTTYAIDYQDWDDASPERGQWDAAVEARNAQQAVADPDVMAYIGTYNSGAAKISMPILNQAGLAMVSPANTAIGLTKPSGEPGEPGIYRPTGRVTYFRVVPADDVQGLAGVRWGLALGATKAFVLHDREAYGKGLADSFRGHAETLGLPVIGFEAIDWKASNYRPLVMKIRASGADLVYFGGTTQTNGGQIVKDLAAAGVTARFLCPDGCFEHAFITAAGAAHAAGRVHVTFGGVPPAQLTGAGAAFVARYRARFGGEPEAYAVYGYTCALVVLEALRRAGRKDRAAVVDAIAATTSVDGPLGTWRFDANGDTTLTTMSGSVVRDGAWSFDRILGP
jgi:branched-chain amino acid transport system substrate-binding protein